MYELIPTEDGKMIVKHKENGQEWIWPDQELPLEVFQAVGNEIQSYLQASKEVVATPPAEEFANRHQEKEYNKMQKNTGRARNEFGSWFHQYSPTGWNRGGWHPGYAPNVSSGAEGYALARGGDYYRNWLGQQTPGGGAGLWGNPQANAGQFYNQAWKDHYNPPQAEGTAPADPYANKTQDVNKWMQSAIDYMWKGRD